ncbi:hypothetical protein FHX81_2956 [Saccharothrix saharensis]|uniref:Uncharacterized protein n=1 Tax=Saccharothrix saharensis TaxID=571190 RepID=A0A543JCN3_9PSEU|nr:hypothetical protein [Saccharothrix saharensis]TQM80615.1 hypothetical protein FHX81_2956 [Saccharothrix saharensis]
MLIKKLMGALAVALAASVLAVAPASAAETWCGTAANHRVAASNVASAKAEGRTIAVRYYNNHVFSVIYGAKPGDAVAMGWQYSGNSVAYWCGKYGDGWPTWSTVPSGSGSAFTAAVPFTQVNWAFARGKLTVSGYVFNTSKVYI